MSETSINSYFSKSMANQEQMAKYFEALCIKACNWIWSFKPIQKVTKTGSGVCIDKTYCVLWLSMIEILMQKREIRFTVIDIIKGIRMLLIQKEFWLFALLPTYTQTHKYCFNRIDHATIVLYFSQSICFGTLQTINSHVNFANNLKKLRCNKSHWKSIV